MTAETEHNFKAAKFLIAILIVFIFVTLIASLAIKHSETFGFENIDNGIRYTRADLGTLGDFIGGLLNPILTFATVCLLVWSIQVQVAELRLTKGELARTADSNEKLVKLQLLNAVKENVVNELSLLHEVQHEIFDREAAFIKVGNTMITSFEGLIHSFKENKFSEKEFMNALQYFESQMSESLENQRKLARILTYALHELEAPVFIFIREIQFFLEDLERFYLVFKGMAPKEKLKFLLIADLFWQFNPKILEYDSKLKPSFDSNFPNQK